MCLRPARLLVRLLDACPKWCVAWLDRLLPGRRVGLLGGGKSAGDAVSYPFEARERLSRCDFGATPRFLCVMDFECTCTPRNRDPHEIIEFPAVLLDLEAFTAGDYDVLKVPRFSKFVRPTEVPKLSGFCRRLTSIQQADVDAAEPLDAVLKHFDAFLEAHVTAGATFAVATDGPTDIKQFLLAECDRKHLKCPDYFTRWVDVSRHLRKYYPNTKCSLMDKVARVGLRWHGTPHRGIDDATNIALLAAKLHQLGSTLAVNDGAPTNARRKR
ncbi:ribonuclease H-like domain-containing protein [Pelagophyceae sp. CCMP2097]|nr:ribonuclease H-like domain-containing protein [Pelagophyceae sp. CCMP2097]